MALVPSEAPGARRRPEAPGGAGPEGPDRRGRTGGAGPEGPDRRGRTGGAGPEGPEGPGWTASAREPGSRRIIPAQRRSRQCSFHRTKLPLAAAGDTSDGAITPVRAPVMAPSHR